MQTHTMANRAVLPDYSDRIARAFHPVPFSPACLACRCTCNVDMEFIHNIILAFPYSFVKRIYSLFCIIFKTFNLILSLYLIWTVTSIVTPHPHVINKCLRHFNSPTLHSLGVPFCVTFLHNSLMNSLQRIFTDHFCRKDLSSTFSWLCHRKCQK